MQVEEVVELIISLEFQLEQEEQVEVELVEQFADQLEVVQLILEEEEVEQVVVVVVIKPEDLAVQESLLLEHQDQLI
jgi:hypothetical protein